MKKIRWGTQHTEGQDGRLDPQGIPKVRGYRYATEEHTNVRLYEYTSGGWGVQVTVQLDARATSLEAAKRKAAAILKVMTENA